jgi:flagellar basal body-associated protein FliL
MSEVKEPPQDATAALEALEKELGGTPSEGTEPVLASAPEPAAVASAPTEPVRKKREAKEKIRSDASFLEGGRSRRLSLIKQRLGEIAASLQSPDGPTRKGAMLFFASIFGLVVVTSVAGHRYYLHVREMRVRAARITRERDAILAEFLRKRSEIAKRKNSTLLLGGFTVALAPSPDGRDPSSFHSAEVEIVLECDSKESRDFLEEHITEARNETTDAFVHVGTQDLMGPEGKAFLKRQLQQRLNLLLPKGRVESVYFSKLVLD